MTSYQVLVAPTQGTLNGLDEMADKLERHGVKEIRVGQGNYVAEIYGPSFIHTAMRSVACQLTTLKTVFEVVVVLSNATDDAIMLLRTPDPRTPGHKIDTVTRMLTSMCEDPHYTNPDWRSTLLELLSVSPDQRADTLDIVRENNVIRVTLKPDAEDVLFNMSALLRHVCCYCMVDTRSCMCVNPADLPLSTVYVHSIEVTDKTITISLRRMMVMAPTLRDPDQKRLSEDQH